MKVAIYCLIIMCAITMATAKPKPDHNGHKRRVFLPTWSSSPPGGQALYAMSGRIRRGILPDPYPQNPTHKHGSPPINPERNRIQLWRSKNEFTTFDCY